MLSLSNVQPGDNGATFHVVITDTCNRQVSSNPAWLFVESPACNDPFADADNNGTVDLNDYAAWQRCYTGPTGTGFDAAECSCFDRDGDVDVDDGEDGQSDLDAFINCASSHPIPADPDCDGPSGGVTLYSDNFDAGTSAASWTKFSTDTDHVADFAYNYSAAGIPSAPNSTGGTTIGLLMRVNDVAPAANTAVSVYPNGQNFSGNYRLTFDVWMNYNNGPGGGSGSTHHMSAGINTTGTQVVWNGATTTDDGYSMALAGEGGGPDYTFYVGKTFQPAGPVYYAPAGSRENTDPYYTALFPSPTYETAGAPGKHWVTVEISQIGGVISWKLNGAPIASKADTTFTSGNIMLGYMDLFPGVAAPPEPQYIIYDNVRVIAD
jgi:hypothetical protein